MRVLVSLLSIFGACSAAADPLALGLLDAERHLGVHARHAALRSAEPDTAERLDAQLKLLELQVADSKLSLTQRQKAEGVLRLLQAVRDQPRTLDGQPELPHQTVAVGQAGRSCAQAIPLDQGDARRVPIAAGESLWFRVQLPDAVNLGLSTRGSGVDAALTVHADCRTVDQLAVAHADDNYGLQAELVVPAARQSFWMVRYENLSPVGGDAVLRATTSGILQGTVRTREGQLVPGPQPRVDLFRRQGSFWNFLGSATLTNGNFSLSITQPGIYAARTLKSSNSPFLDQAFENINCAGFSSWIDACNNGTVTQITHDGTETREISFNLDRGVPIVGTVRNTLGQPIAGALVQARLENGSSLSMNTDAFGRYRFDGNNPGTARLIAGAPLHRTVMYNNITCTSSCNFPDAATPLPLIVGSTAVADFTLPEAPSLTVVASLSNDLITNLFTTFRLSLMRPNGSVVTEASISSFSPNVTLTNVAPGDYILRLQSPNTVPRLYPDIECADDCIAELGKAQRIVIPQQAVAVQVHFQARRYPMISGTLRDIRNGQPIATQGVSARMEILRLGSTATESFDIGSSGEYFLRGIAPGTYVLRASRSAFQSSVHDGFTCTLPLNQCAEFTPVTIVRNGVDQRIDFFLTPLGRLFVTSNVTSNFSQSLSMLTTDGAITAEFQLPSDISNGIAIDGIPLGTQIIGLRGSGTFPQLFDRVDCLTASSFSFSGCPFVQATPLTIQSGQSQAVSFAPRPRNARRVLVRGADTNAPLGGMSVDLWSAAGLLTRSFVTGPDGAVWISSFDSGVSNFALSTDNRRGYLDQVHAGISCPNGSAFLGLCSLSGATPISLPAPDNNQPTIEILLQRETPLFRNGFEPAN